MFVGVYQNCLNMVVLSLAMLIFLVNSRRLEVITMYPFNFAVSLCSKRGSGNKVNTECYRCMLPRFASERKFSYVRYRCVLIDKKKYVDSAFSYAEAKN